MAPVKPGPTSRESEAITSMPQSCRRAHPFRLAATAALLAVGSVSPAAAASACYARCDNNYYLCNRGGASPGERSCSTARSTCYMGCGQARDRFGAIAYSKSTTAYGESYRHDTREQAEQRAREECAIRGPGARDCEVLVWFNKSCGALALGRNGAYGADHDEDPAVATQKAMAHCRPFGAASCAVVSKICSR
jgi:hypothetical protein